MGSQPISGAQPPSGTQDTKRALLDALQESVHDVRVRAEHQEQVQRQRSRRPVSKLLVAGLLTFTSLTAWLLIARPDWIFAPTASAQSPQQLEAGLRIGLYLEARRIHEYQARRGRPPRALTEAGGSPAGSHYTLRDDGRWTLEAAQAGQSLRITSDDSLSTFLGTSFTTIRGVRR
ncbi:MAG: hypothetical protein ACREMH_11970 [Gemmatimonadales bacterium]